MFTYRPENPSSIFSFTEKYETIKKTAQAITRHLEEFCIHWIMQLSRSMLEVVVIQNTQQVAEYVYAQNKLYILVYTIF